MLFFHSHSQEQWTRPVAQKLLCVMCARVLPGEHSSSTFAHAWPRSTRAAHHTLLTRCMHLPQLTTTTTTTITTYHHFCAAHPQLFGVALMLFGSFILMPRLESRVRLCATASTRSLAFLHSLDQIDRIETFKLHCCETPCVSKFSCHTARRQCTETRIASSHPRAMSL